MHTVSDSWVGLLDCCKTHGWPILPLASNASRLCSHSKLGPTFANLSPGWPAHHSWSLFSHSCLRSGDVNSIGHSSGRQAATVSIMSAGTSRAGLDHSSSVIHCFHFMQIPFERYMQYMHAPGLARSPCETPLFPLLTEMVRHEFAGPQVLSDYPQHPDHSEVITPL